MLSVLLCPICRRAMAQIATGLHQCGHCGYGPSLQGHRGYWAVFDVFLLGDCIHATSIRYDSDLYIISRLTWRVDADGRALGSRHFHEELIDRLPGDLVNDLPLPVVILSKEKWELPENTPPLRHQMFSDPRGAKTFALTSGPPGKSATVLVPSVPGASYPSP